MKSLAFWVATFLFSIYLLTFSGKFHVMDELAVFAAGNNLAQYGRADINQLIWTHHWTPNPPGIWGNDGHLYTKKAPGISFIAAPLMWLGHHLPGLNAVHMGLLTNMLVTALTAAILFLWLIDLEFTPQTALLTALGYGLCTIAWIYARMFWESSLLALSFLIAVWTIYRATHLSEPRSQLWILSSGLSIAIGLTLRFETLPAIFFIAVYLILSIKKACLRSLGLFFLPSLLIGIALLYFNFIRYGSISETGYTQELLFQAPWIGGFGLLFSPGRGLFIYAPLMWLLFFGLRPAWRRLPRFYWSLIVILCLFYWLFYGAWFAWGGTWGWGPRFLLPILPLLMLFVAEPIEWVQSAPPSFYRHMARLGIIMLILLSLFVNFLGLSIDFNEHFLRLGRNDNFVFNWETFPPLAHWQILQEQTGTWDIIWLRSPFEWSILLLVAMTTIGLIGTYYRLIIKQESLDWKMYFLFSIIILFLTYRVMLVTSASALALADKADLPLLDQLNRTAQLDDALYVAMPPFGDVQEITTLMMAYLDVPIPTFIWIENPPRSIQPEERERIWRAIQSTRKRVWLFERWLTVDDPLSKTTTRLNQQAFPLKEAWFEQSGKVTLYALSDDSLLSPVPLQTTFQGGVTLLDFSIAERNLSAGEILKLRLTWQAATGEMLVQSSQSQPLIVFVQLLDETGQNVAQQDRLLVNPHRFEQSPLVPEGKVPQGYGLRLPESLVPGNYALIVGLYQANTGLRLHRTDDQQADDFLYLTDIQISQSKSKN